MKRRVTIKDIAAAAGVHYSTVSLALRGHPRISTDVRETVQATAQRLGYVPDPMLSALIAYRNFQRRRPSGAVLAYLVGNPQPDGDLAIHTHRAYWQGASERAAALGYRLERFWLREPGVTPQRWSRIFFHRGIRGLLLASFPGDLESIDLAWDRFCAVRISHSPHRPALPTVAHHQYQIVRLAFRHARERGYRRLGLALVPLADERSDRAWSGGFLVEQQTVPTSDRLPILKDRWDRESFVRWIRTHRPDAILSLVTHSNVFDWIRAAGARVPEDIGFVGLDLEQPNGTVAGIRQDSHAVGRAAIDRLVTSLQFERCGIPTLEETTLIAGSWCDGATLPPKPAGTPQRAPRARIPLPPTSQNS